VCERDRVSGRLTGPWVRTPPPAQGRDGGQTIETYEDKAETSLTHILHSNMGKSVPAKIST